MKPFDAVLKLATAPFLMRRIEMDSVGMLEDDGELSQSPFAKFNRPCRASPVLVIYSVKNLKVPIHECLRRRLQLL